MGEDNRHVRETERVTNKARMMWQGIDASSMTVLHYFDIQLEDKNINATVLLKEISKEYDKQRKKIIEQETPDELVSHGVSETG